MGWVRFCWGGTPGGANGGANGGGGGGRVEDTVLLTPLSKWNMALSKSKGRGSFGKSPQ